MSLATQSLGALIHAAGTVAKSVPKPARALAYGTAGFRERAELLDSTFLRVGFIAALRAIQCRSVRARPPA